MSQVIPQEIVTACRRFYKLFDFFPEKVGVHWKRTPDMLNVVCFPHMPPVAPVDLTRLFDECDKVMIQNISIPIEPVYGIAWNEFVIYSEATGMLKPADLELNAETVKRMVELKGYEVYIFPNQHYHNTIELMSIRKGNQFIQWAFPRDLYQQDLILIKTDIKHQLQKFSQAE